ncbi:tRNA uracil 4-sulfurtransferase ThiI [Anaerococcus sp. Marseille-Q7828]|uniref:tRNA uracil 4-sulfurtransferase ThiI n=1 Tax=Anaerococcus sp. Marseille-Q7828 TaxID=3036300 RepID=UPI0024AD044A|nr:tRNA uracil 4-sulfurtransferase ThiI [Anaerococcus sp. Marseille-Q7828]
MKALISVSFGELFLKGANRKQFYNNALSHIFKNIKSIGYDKYYTESAKLYIEANEENFEAIIEQLQKVFGIAYIDIVYRTEKNEEDIFEAIKKSIIDAYGEDELTFKVQTKRVDKSFKYQSPEFNMLMGDKILDEFPNLKVDIHDPDFKVFIDIKNNAYIYSKRYAGLGGLPIGSSGNGLLMLSGGIDSPVAGYLMAKRGMKVNALHFHSYPYTSLKAKQKAIDLAEIMSDYTGPMNLFMVNLSEIYKAIATNCDRRETTILSRRFMVRIAEKLSEKYEYKALITGDSLGQVASQTLESLSVVEEATSLPLLRPLIAMDKKDIVDLSKDIGSYEKSIEPFDDCCSIFAPDNPLTKPKLHYIKMSEEKLDIDKLVDESLDTIEIIRI